MLSRSDTIRLVSAQMQLPWLNCKSGTPIPHSSIADAASVCHTAEWTRYSCRCVPSSSTVLAAHQSKPSPAHKGWHPTKRKQILIPGQIRVSKRLRIYYFWRVRLARILDPLVVFLLFTINGLKVIIHNATREFHQKIQFFTIKSYRYVYG